MRDRAQPLKDVLWLLAVAGAVAIGLRLWFGLGATTNLSDAVPWGLWKIMNMVAGVALATGGFTIGFLVYVLKRNEFRPLVTPAILIAFLGYGSSVFALVLDIGLPHRIWHPIVMWNEHSFLFEVAWCVMLYFTVTMIELSPTLMTRLRLDRAAHLLHRVAFGVVVIGISLSSLHHSSLGSLFLVTPQRLHPLWYSPRLPLVFILSAMGAGLMVVVLAKLIYARLYPAQVSPPERPLEMPGRLCAIAAAPARFETESDLRLLGRIASMSAVILALVGVVKVADLWATGSIRWIGALTFESYLYVAEMLTASAVPVLLVALPRTRRTAGGLAAAGASAVVGLVLHRLNVGIFGYFRDAGTVYVPSLAEWALSFGIIAAAGLVFLYACEYLPVFDDSWRQRQQMRARFVPLFDRLSGVWSPALSGELRRTTLVAAFVIPVAWTALYPPFHRRADAPEDHVTAPLAADAERTRLTIDGNRRDLVVAFPHGDHQRRLGGDAGCQTCHHLSLPRDHSTACSRCHRQMDRPVALFDHDAHFGWVATRDRLAGAHPSNHACRRCHDPGRPKTASTATGCPECHRTDMRPASAVPATVALASPRGYRAALHETCVECHRTESTRLARPQLASCTTCHPQRPGDPRGLRLAVPAG